MPGTIKIALGATAIEIKAFTTYRPSLVSDGGINYSLAGAAIDGGPGFEAKYLWEIGSILEHEEALLLKAIFAESDRLRRSLAPFSLLIYDTITPVVEAGAVNTRAIVPTTALTPVGAGAVSYYAQYRGGFVAPPKMEPYPTGIWQVDFSIAEHDRVVP